MKKALDGYLKNRLWINFAILVCFFIGHCFASWVTYIVFPLLIIMILADTLENGLSYIMFGIPFCCLYPYISVIFFCVGVAGWIIKFYLIYFIKDKGKVSWLELLFMGLFLVYAIMPIGPYTMNMLLKVAIIFFIYAILLALSKKREVFRMTFNVRILSIALLVACVLGLFFFVSPYLKATIYAHPAMVGSKLVRYQALFPNTNVLAMFCEMLIAIFAYRMIKKPEVEKERKWIDGVLFVAFSIIGITTFSKTYILVFIAILITLFICMMFKNWKITLPVGLGVVAIFVAIYFIKPALFNAYVQRFIGALSSGASADQIMNVLTTGRWDMWKVTIAFLGHNPLRLFFGRGIGAGPLSPNPLSPHNAYISLIDQLGIVGAILFIIPLVFLIRDVLKSREKKVSKAILIPIITLAGLFLVEDVIFFIFPI